MQLPGKTAQQADQEGAAAEDVSAAAADSERRRRRRRLALEAFHTDTHDDKEQILTQTSTERSEASLVAFNWLKSEQTNTRFSQ